MNKTAEKETTRLEAFSDGVFAIAITLLVLELKVPTFSEPLATMLSHEVIAYPTSAELGAELAKDWPSYLALVTSFFTVLIMWVHHHALFKLVCKPDTCLLFANGLLLLLITVVPYPTAVLARYVETPAGPMAAGFYAGFFVLIAVAFRLTMWAFRRGVVDPHAPEAILRKFRRSYRIGPPAYLVATLLAFVSPWLTLAVLTALWIFWAAMTIERRGTLGT